MKAERKRSVLICGGGLLGLSSAVELARRGGYSITVVDANEIPSPLAASTDISKIVRLDYGDDRSPPLP